MPAQPDPNPYLILTSAPLSIYCVRSKVSLIRKEFHGNIYFLEKYFISGLSKNERKKI